MTQCAFVKILTIMNDRSMSHNFSKGIVFYLIKNIDRKKLCTWTRYNLFNFLFLFLVGRTDPNLDDLGLAFQEMGVNLSELSDYVKHSDPLPFAKEPLR